MRNMYYELSSNKILWTSVLAWFAAQSIKTLIDIWHEGKINLHVLLGTGGMPSSHSSFVTAMSTSMGLTQGFNSPLFALSAVFSMIVMYDAAGVRRAAGKQAEVLNMLVETFEEQGVVIDKKLKELLGHTPIEVFAGAILGIAIGLYVHAR